MPSKAMSLIRVICASIAIGQLLAACSYGTATEPDTTSQSYALPPAGDAGQ